MFKKLKQIHIALKVFFRLLSGDALKATEVYQRRKETSTAVKAFNISKIITLVEEEPGDSLDKSLVAAAIFAVFLGRLRDEFEPSAADSIFEASFLDMVSYWDALRTRYPKGRPSHDQQTEVAKVQRMLRGKPKK